MGFAARNVRRTGWLGIVAFALAVLPVAPAPAAAQQDKPPGYEFYQSYAEVKAAIDDTAAAHPTIAARFALSDYAAPGDSGKSYEGREIWGIEITRNVQSDPVRPAIFINALIHARERASEELALYVMHVLTDNYGRNTRLGRRVTRIVNTRSVYIVPMMNPDGAEYDFSGGSFHRWRKNRQPIPGSDAIGVDLNRQFGYTWNCCGGSSGNPASVFYRGPSPWWAPETVAYRDFVDALANQGRPLTEILSLHSEGRLVLWPYIYTRDKLPPDMTADDHATFVALGRNIAARNGYRPEQASHLYIVDGDQDDWAYGTHGIFALTIELPRGRPKRYYPTHAQIKHFDRGNRGAVLYLLEQADCPYRAAGLAAGHCS